VSGFQPGGWFDLTGKKADYWHERCPEHHGLVLDLEALWVTHLEPAGFVRLDAPSRYMLRLSGPGIAEGSTDLLYQALTSANARSW
jgi:hypothetical protein